MSYHIMHLLSIGSRISVDRGFLVCSYPDDSSDRIAMADIRAIIAAAPGISFSNDAIARLLEQDSLILHCNRSYKPVGWSFPLTRVIREKAFTNQIAGNDEFTRSLWKIILRQKMLNQARLLDMLSLKHSLYKLIEKPLASEANVAKQFWQNYFKALNAPQTREYKMAESFENKALNYGYAVVSSLVLRSILVHGLLPDLGIHHKERYRSLPLVYDLQEPLRVFVELFLYQFIQEHSKEELFPDFKAWIRYISTKDLGNATM